MTSHHVGQRISNLNDGSRSLKISKRADQLELPPITQSLQIRHHSGRDGHNKAMPKHLSSSEQQGGFNQIDFKETLHHSEHSDTSLSHLHRATSVPLNADKRSSEALKSSVSLPSPLSYSAVPLSFIDNSPHLRGVPSSGLKVAPLSPTSSKEGRGVQRQTESCSSNNASSFRHAPSLDLLQDIEKILKKIREIMATDPVEAEGLFLSLARQIEHRGGLSAFCGRQDLVQQFKFLGSEIEAVEDSVAKIKQTSRTQGNRLMTRACRCLIDKEYDVCLQLLQHAGKHYKMAAEHERAKATVCIAWKVEADQSWDKAFAYFDSAEFENAVHALVRAKRLYQQYASSDSHQTCQMLLSLSTGSPDWDQKVYTDLLTAEKDRMVAVEDIDYLIEEKAKEVLQTAGSKISEALTNKNVALGKSLVNNLAFVKGFVNVSDYDHFIGHLDRRVSKAELEEKMLVLRDSSKGEKEWAEVLRFLPNFIGRMVDLQLIKSEHVLETVLERMSTHTDSGIIELQGLLVLEALRHKGLSAASCIQNGVLSTLASLLNKCTDTQKEVCQKALTFSLSILSSQSHLLTALKLGFGGALTHIRNTFCDDPEFTLWLIESVTNLVVHPSSAEQLEQSGFFLALLLSLQRHSQHSEVVLTIIGLFHMLLKRTTLKALPSLREPQVVSILTLCLKRNCTRANIVAAVLEFLRQIRVGELVNKVKAPAKEELQDVLHRCLKIYSGNEIIKQSIVEMQAQFSTVDNTSSESKGTSSNPNKKAYHQRQRNSSLLLSHETKTSTIMKEKRLEDTEKELADEMAKIKTHPTTRPWRTVIRIDGRTLLVAVYPSILKSSTEQTVGKIKRLIVSGMTLADPSCDGRVLQVVSSRSAEECSREVGCKAPSMLLDFIHRKVHGPSVTRMVHTYLTPICKPLPTMTICAATASFQYERGSSHILVKLHERYHDHAFILVRWMLHVKPFPVGFIQRKMPTKNVEDIIGVQIAALQGAITPRAHNQALKDLMLDSLRMILRPSELGISHSQDKLFTPVRLEKKQKCNSVLTGINNDRLLKALARKIAASSTSCGLSTVCMRKLEPACMPRQNFVARQFVIHVLNMQVTLMASAQKESLSK